MKKSPESPSDKWYAEKKRGNVKSIMDDTNVSVSIGNINILYIANVLWDGQVINNKYNIPCMLSVASQSRTDSQFNKDRKSWTIPSRWELYSCKLV